MDLLAGYIAGFAEVMITAPLDPTDYAADLATYTAIGASLPGTPDACFLCPLDADNGTVRSEHRDSRREMAEEFGITTLHTILEFQIEQIWLQEIIFGTFILPAMQLMTEQMSAAAMNQAFIIGTFFDAEQNLATQRLYQKLTAKAHRKYHPSLGVCTIGTNVRSLLSAERNGEYTAFIMSQRSLDRQIGNMNSVASRGQHDDFKARLDNFRTYYCDYYSYGGGLDPVCNFDANEDGIPDTDTPVTAKRDVAFTRVADKRTLDIDFTDLSPSEDERDVFALATNLYSHNTAFRTPEMAFRTPDGQDEILDLRSLIAKRSVAEHSYNTFVGLRTPGSPVGAPETAQYMENVLENLGIDDTDEIDEYLGERPSYYAQMEVLTKRIFQQPDFYTNLYDKPVNVDRKAVSLQAIGLMQSFDTWQSYLRTEAMLSVLLELEIMKLQDEVQNRLNALRS